jgi:hypothetical protein
MEAKTAHHPLGQGFRNGLLRLPMTFFADWDSFQAGFCLVFFDHQNALSRISSLVIIGEPTHAFP